jgi:hypothetical protein
MGTAIHPCGCTVTQGLDGIRPILFISLCIQHAQDQEMQRALETALSKLRALLEVSADA